MIDVTIVRERPGRWAGTTERLHSLQTIGQGRKSVLPQHHVDIEGYDSACKCVGEYIKTSRRCGSVHKHGRCRAGVCER